MRKLVVLMTALMAGCNHYEPLSLHGAASRRVEVEVYKGPLTAPVEGEVGELFGTLAQSIRILDDWNERSKLAPCNDGPGTACNVLISARGSAKTYISTACFYIKSQIMHTNIGFHVNLPVSRCDSIREFDATSFSASAKRGMTFAP